MYFIYFNLLHFERIHSIMVTLLTLEREKRKDCPMDRRKNKQKHLIVVFVSSFKNKYKMFKPSKLILIYIKSDR